MKQKKILIVEDERLIADDIKLSIKKMGHAVCGMVSSGEEAIKKAEETHPDLILMDIVLKGQMDGTETAAIIRDRYHIPILYLSAYADDKTIERAKVTEPFGYIVKPFENRELNSMIEIALYKHKIEKRLKESEEWLSTTLKSIGDAVIATDTESCVIFMNPVAQTLTGWRQEEAKGRALREVFNVINENTDEQEDDPASRVLHKGKAIRLADHTILISKDGTKRHIDDSCTLIKTEKGDIAGVVLIFRDITERKMLQSKLMQAEKMATIGTMAASVAHELRNPLGVIKTATIYLGGSFDQRANTSINNLSEDPTNLMVFGTDNFTGEMEWNSNSDFWGAVYVPQADVRFRSNTDFYGSIIGKSFDLDSNAKIHYDKALAGLNIDVDSDEIFYKVKSWQEKLIH